MPPDPSQATRALLDREGLEALGLDILGRLTDSPGTRLRLLRGYRGPESFALREALWRDGAPNRDLAMSLPRRSSPQAHVLRRKLIDVATAEALADVARSLHHCPGPEAHAFRMELLEKGLGRYDIADSLRGCDDEADHALRRELLANGVRSACIANSLRGCGSPASVALRRELLALGTPAADIVYSLLLSRATEVANALLRELRPAGRDEAPDPQAIAWPTAEEIRREPAPAAWIDAFFFRHEDDQML